MAKNEIHLNNLGRKQTEFIGRFGAEVVPALRLNA
jgi:hypothetical protein